MSRLLSPRNAAFRRGAGRNPDDADVRLEQLDRRVYRVDVLNELAELAPA